MPGIADHMFLEQHTGAGVCRAGQNVGDDHELRSDALDGCGYDLCATRVRHLHRDLDRR